MQFIEISTKRLYIIAEPLPHVRGVQQRRSTLLTLACVRPVLFQRFLRIANGSISKEYMSMKSKLVRWFGATLVAGTLTFAGGLPSVQAAVTTITDVGVPGTPFTFNATGFRGNEPIAYWINTPDGKVISTDPLETPDQFGKTTKPLVTESDADGNVIIYWTAPSNALVGSYSLVVQGLETSRQSVVSFKLNPPGSQTVTQYGATPAAGPAGTPFVFDATGFRGSAVIDGESISYWINTPSGAIISTDPLETADQRGNTTKPLVARADTTGLARIYWTAPVSLQPGNYTLLVHGDTSQHQVSIPFTIK